MRKNILLFSILLTLFFVGIKGVSASTCEYSLAQLNVYNVYDTGSSLQIQTTSDIILETDSKLIMTINDTFAQGSQNISWSVSDGAFALDSPTNFSASTSSTSVESGYENEQITYYKSCPVLRILYTPVSGVYHIKNIVLTTDSNSQLNNDAVTLTSIYNGNWPSEGSKISKLTKYDFATNSAYSSGNGDSVLNNYNGSYCEDHPDDPYCKSIAQFLNAAKSAVQDDGTFEFCESKGVLTTLNVIHVLLTIARITVPLIIIIMASVAFFKATIANDEKANAKAFKDLMISVIVGIIVFFIPTIVYAIVNLSGNKNSSFKSCQVCFTGKDGNCKSLIDGAKSK